MGEEYPIDTETGADTLSPILNSSAYDFSAGSYALPIAITSGIIKYHDSGSSGGDYTASESRAATFDAGLDASGNPHQLWIKLNSFNMEADNQAHYDRLGITASNNVADLNLASSQLSIVVAPILSTFLYQTSPFTTWVKSGVISTTQTPETVWGDSYVNSNGGYGIGGGWLFPNKASGLDRKGHNNVITGTWLVVKTRYIRFYFKSDGSVQKSGWDIDIARGIYTQNTTGLTLNNYDATVYLQSDKSTWLNTFYFQLAEGKEPKFKYKNTDNNTDILSIANGYSSTETTYAANKIVDVGATAVTIFIKELARHVFGSDQTVSFFSNTGTMITSIQDSLVSGANNINTDIDTSGNTFITVTDSSTMGYKTSKEIYNDFISFTDRLTLIKNITSTGPALPVSSTITGLTDQGVNYCNVSVTTDPNGDILNIAITGDWGGYTKGSDYTFTNGTYTIVYSDITSYQAAFLNGTLFTDEIEYPFETNDIIDVAITVKSATTQTNAGDNSITAERVVRYRIKLV